MKNIDDFLKRHAGDVDAESGAFTINPDRAREQTLEYLKSSPGQFCVHFLAGAAILGATQMRLYSDSKKAANFFRRGKKSKTFVSLYADAVLSKKQLDKLASPLVNHSSPALLRLSWTLHQLSFLKPSWLRLTTLKQGQGYTLTWWPARTKWEICSQLEPGTEFTGLILECSPIKKRLPSAFKRVKDPLFDGFPEFVRAARWSSLDCFLEDRLLNIGKPEGSALHFIPKQTLSGAEFQAWLETPPSFSEAVIVADGITLDPIRLSPQIYGEAWFPGVKLVLWPQQPLWDASQLQLVRDQSLEQLLTAALERARRMLPELALSQDRACRHYLLNNWERFPHLPLETYPLFRTLEGSFMSLNQLRASSTDEASSPLPLDPEDSELFGIIAGFHHPYRFLRGGAPAQTYTLCPRGRWLALTRDQTLHFHSVSAPHHTHSPNSAVANESLSWHSSEPWVAFSTPDGACVWDLKLEKELASFRGDFCSLAFSRYGRYLNLYEQAAPRRVSYWKVTVAGFDMAKEPFELPGRSPTAVGNLLLLWQNERRFQVRHFGDLSTLLQEFSTEEPVSRLLDTSPCHGFALLGGDRATYLYDIRHQTLRKLPVVAREATFSWASDLLFVTHRNGKSVLDLACLRETPVSERIVHFFRSGIALIDSDPNSSLTAVSLLGKPQPSALQDYSALFPRQEEGTFPSLLAYSEEGAETELLRFGVSRAAALGSSELGSDLMAISCPGGSRLHDLQTGNLMFAPDSQPLNFRLMQRFGDVAWLLDPVSLQPHLGSIRGREFELVYHHPEYLIITNEQGRVSVVKADLVEELDHRITPSTPFQPSGINRLPGYPGLFVCVRGGRLAFGRVDPKTCSWENAASPFPFEIQANRFCFSPSGHLAALSDWEISIIHLERRELAGRIPADCSDGPLVFLSERFLYAGGTVWRPSPDAGWSRPLGSLAKLPERLVAIPRTHLAIEERGPEHRLYNLLSGAVVGVYRSLAEHWFVFTPGGEWDGSRGCLRHLKPHPANIPTPNLLGKLFKAHLHI